MLVSALKQSGCKIAAAEFMNEPNLAAMGGAPDGYDAAVRAGLRPVLDALLAAAHRPSPTRDDLVAAVNRISGGKGARVIFDPVAGPFVETLAEAAARAGIRPPAVCVIGAVAGLGLT